MLGLNVLQSVRLQRQESEMTIEDQVHQMMLERHEMLADALERAEAGRATEDDWNTIRFECGVSRRPKSTENRSE